ncbi:acyl-CoA synthetase [Bordetella sp. H567]|uniref:AMP-binding protein n=1 Tax=Bordetella sp. H567 TaxID=1697043 RepID=UPI00081C93C4|nr:AMP-binding protein [Bordetella sp. H567]AOB30763.1 acyl-CoA synthetase [Bordetella sp. H567]
MSARQAETFAARLDAWAAREPAGIALIDGDTPVTVSALREHAARLAGALADAGMRAGDRVAIWLPNGEEWVAGFLACARIGALALAVNTRFRARELADVLGRGRADWLLYWPGFKDIDFDAILSDVPATLTRRLRGVCLAGAAGAPSRGPAGVPAYSLRAMMAEGTPLAEAAADGPAICFTTSGTTSLPKFVVHGQATLLRHGDQVARAYGHDDGARILAAAPFCGVFGFAALAGGLAPGIPVVCQAVFNARHAADAISRHRVTHAYLNNEALQRMLDAAPGNDYSSVRLFGFASFAPGLESLPARAAAHGIATTGLYGSSELIALVAAQPLQDAVHRYLPGGRLIYPDARVRVRDPASGRLGAPGESGEIEILSPSLMLGYLDDPVPTSRALTPDGYFRTGDLGYVVDQTQFVFQGRMGDSLRLAGFLVNSAEIEACIAALPGIRACQVVGTEHQGTTVPYAFVLLEDGAIPDPAAWRTACRRAMAAFKVPAGFHVLPAFPVVESANSVKVQKNRLRELAAQLMGTGP